MYQLSTYRLCPSLRYLLISVVTTAPEIPKLNASFISTDIAIRAINPKWIPILNHKIQQLDSKLKPLRLWMTACLRIKWTWNRQFLVLTYSACWFCLDCHCLKNEAYSRVWCKQSLYIAWWKIGALSTGSTTFMNCRCSFLTIIMTNTMGE